VLTSVPRLAERTAPAAAHKPTMLQRTMFLLVSAWSCSGQYEIARVRPSRYCADRTAKTAGYGTVVRFDRGHAFILCSAAARRVCRRARPSSRHRAARMCIRSTCGIGSELHRLRWRSAPDALVREPNPSMVRSRIKSGYTTRTREQGVTRLTGGAAPSSRSNLLEHRLPGQSPVMPEWDFASSPRVS
jgi:hypothetical protein